MIARLLPAAALLACAVAAVPARAEMRTWEGWGSFGIPFLAQPEIAMPSCDSLDIVAEDAIGFVYRRLSPRARKAERIGWQWRVREAPAPGLLGTPNQDRALAVHLLFEPPGREGAYSEWRLRLFGFPREAHVLTYVWGGVNAPGSVAVNPYHERGRLVVLRNGLGEYGAWQGERVDFRADFRELFAKPAQEPAWLVVSTDSDDTGAATVAALRGLFFEDAAGRFGPCEGQPASP